MVLQRPSGFIEPCLPSKVARPPSGPSWVHEIKRVDWRGSGVSRGYDWADGFPAIIEAANQGKRRGREAALFG